MVEIQVDPKRELGKALDRALKKTDDLTIPLQLIAQNWFKSNRAIFSLKSAGKYEDLSTKPFFAFWEQGELQRYFGGGYKEFKIAKWGFAYPILKRTGRLERSLTNAADAEAVESIINKNSLELGTSVPYAIFHGSEEPRSKIPFRPPVLFGNEQVAPGALKQRVSTWEKILVDYALDVSEGKR